MNLKSFNLKEIGTKKVICFGRGVAFLNTFMNLYPIEEHIEMIVDNNEKVHGEYRLHTKIVEVVSPDVLKDIDYATHAIVITSSYYKDIYEQLKDELKNTAVEDIYVFNDDAIENDVRYRAMYKDEPLRDYIIFRSGPMPSQYLKGMDFADNARALFEYMLENGYNQKYKLIWFVFAPDEFKEKYNFTNIEFISFNWNKSKNQQEMDLYYHYLCLAKYIFFTDSYGFANNSRSDQIRVQLWHGCGFKTRLTNYRCEYKYDYMTVISQLYSDIHEKFFGLRKEQLLITGYAKHDWIYNQYKESLAEIFGINPTNKNILWLPTFRIAEDILSAASEKYVKENWQLGLPIVNTTNEIAKLNEILKNKDMSLLIKLHPMQKKSLIQKLNLSNIKVLYNEDLTDKDIILNRLMGKFDALISDYSSAAVDFLNTDKPIAFTLDDVEEYRNSRGFVFDNIRDWLPGKEIFNFEDLCDFIKEISEGKDTTREKRNKIADKMIKYRDSNNCKRICEAFNITVEE